MSGGAHRALRPDTGTARKTEAAGLKQRFAENLILARGRVDLSQEKTAERSGLHQTEISLLERGLRVPRLDTIVKLAGAVEAEACELLAGMAWRPGRNLALPGAYVGQGAFEVGATAQWESS
jgi:transcriptional regulator with XRE-family HTH domain